MTEPSPVLTTTADRVTVITLNRPAARNALSSEVLRMLPAALEHAEADDGVDVVVLTGADPAFCAGLDLKELGADGANLEAGNAAGGSYDDGSPRRGPFPQMTKPVIGAVNGVAVTGGLELALLCSFLVASERAVFADTHSRVGLQPGWGLSVLLPRAIGVRRAREMSVTGNFVDAATAYDWGLVNRVVAHGDLMPTALGLAHDIVGNDQPGLRRLMATYADNESLGEADALRHEAKVAGRWMREEFSPEGVAQRRESIAARGRSQTS